MNPPFSRHKLIFTFDDGVNGNHQSLKTCSSRNDGSVCGSCGRQEAAILMLEGCCFVLMLSHDVFRMVRQRENPADWILSSPESTRLDSVQSTAAAESVSNKQKSLEDALDLPLVCETSVGLLDFKVRLRFEECERKAGREEDLKRRPQLWRKKCLYAEPPAGSQDGEMASNEDSSQASPLPPKAARMIALFRSLEVRHKRRKLKTGRRLWAGAAFCGNESKPENRFST
ncbi:uncharacterized protein V6R79_020821 [Siganus canaliculatus]